MNGRKSIRYPALIDGVKGAYGVSFPDLPGIVAMGDSIDDVLVNAEAALREYVIDTESDGDLIVQPSDLEQISPEHGQALTTVPLIRQSGRSVRIHMAIDEGVAVFIDGEADRRGMTRTAYVEWMARRIAMMGG